MLSREGSWDYILRQIRHLIELLDDVVACYVPIEEIMSLLSDPTTSDACLEWMDRSCGQSSQAFNQVYSRLLDYMFARKNKYTKAITYVEQNPFPQTSTRIICAHMRFASNPHSVQWMCESSNLYVRCSL